MKLFLVLPACLCLLIAFEAASAQQTDSGDLFPQDSLNESSGNNDTNDLLPAGEPQDTDSLTTGRNPLNQAQDAGNPTYAQETIGPIWTFIKVLLALFLFITGIIILSVIIHAVYSLRHIVFHEPPVENTGNVDKGPITQSPAERGED